MWNRRFVFPRRDSRQAKFRPEQDQESGEHNRDVTSCGCYILCRALSAYRKNGKEYRYKKFCHDTRIFHSSNDRNAGICLPNFQLSCCERRVFLSCLFAQPEEMLMVKCSPTAEVIRAKYSIDNNYKLFYPGQTRHKDDQNRSNLNVFRPFFLQLYGVKTCA